MYPFLQLINHFVGISYFFLWLINVLGNGSVIYIFLKVMSSSHQYPPSPSVQVKTLRTPSNMFVVNLALSDFCMMLTQAWPVIINAFSQRYLVWSISMLRTFPRSCYGVSYAIKNQLVASKAPY